MVDVCYIEHVHCPGENDQVVSNFISTFSTFQAILIFLSKMNRKFALNTKNKSIYLKFDMVFYPKKIIFK